MAPASRTSLSSVWPKRRCAKAATRARRARPGRIRISRRRVTINLAPADLPKEGGRYDLAIALGILAASGQLPAACLEDTEFYGELSLSGELRPVRGVLPAAVHACATGASSSCRSRTRMKRASRAAHVSPLHATLSAVQERPARRCGDRVLPREPRCRTFRHRVRILPTCAARPQAKRALEIAAAGGHSLLLIGPPGSGKSMLAQRLPGLLPPLDDDEALESAMLHSLARPLPAVAEWRRRPFRAPHHAASAAAVIGGGGRLRPGEISLAHHGVLFLDELPEYRRVLEALREPLESGRVSIARAAWHGAVSGAIPAGRGDESLPLRLCRRPGRALPLHAADRSAATARGISGPAARSHRPARRGAAARIHGTGAVGSRRRIECIGRFSRAPRPRSTGSARRAQFGASAAGDR